MQIINAKYEIMRPRVMDAASRDAIYGIIEEAARTCYKSEAKITDGSAAAIVKSLIRRGHEAMLEHASMTVRFFVDRGVSHELVRHRIASFAQESTRYCNYAREDFGSSITFIKPVFFREGGPSYLVWKNDCERAEASYFALMEIGETPERARTVLPSSTKTEVVMTMNMREWRHFFRLRAIGTTGTPHPQMREVALPLLKEVANLMPELFGDIAEMEIR